MALKYVDFVNGNDADGGGGPDASNGNASLRPYKTIGKLLGATGMSSGDTAYLSPAGPFREVVTVAMTSAVAETKIIGDFANGQGFKTSGGVLVAPGPVVQTAYTTNDKTTASGTTVMNTNARDFLTFEHITFVAGPGSAFAPGGDATNITFNDCTLFGGPWSNNSIGSLTFTTGIPFHMAFNRCRVFCRGGFSITLPTVAGADYDADIVFTNCFIHSQGVAVDVTASGALANKGGGVVVNGCSVIGGNPSIRTNSANISTTIPCRVENSFILSSQTSVSANTAGQITEEHNILTGSVPRTNVTAGTGSISDGSYALLFHIGQELADQQMSRQFMSPTAGSPLLGFGGSAGAPTTDLLGRGRPAGGASASIAVGALERGNTFAKNTSTVRTGTNSISITGPGYQEYLIPVDASSTTISVYVQWDGTYTGTKPILEMDANGEIGVTAASTTAVGGSGSWEQISLSLTPTGKSFVTVRVRSSDSNGGGQMFVDDWSFV